MKTSDEKIRVVLNFNCDTKTLWNAISNPEIMRLWYFDNIPDFKAKVAFQTQFLITNEGRQFTHNWEITDVIEEKKLSYVWTYDEYPGKSEVQFLIEERPKGSNLNFSFDVLEDFPQDIPEFKRESCIAGWNYFLTERLVDFMGNKNSDR